jgi:hypothetical protein
MIEVFKILNGFYDSDVAPQLKKNSQSCTRGHSFKLSVKQSRLNVHKYSFCNRITQVWNKLPEYVVASSSVNCFKNNLDKAWSSEDFLFDFEGRVPGTL